MNIYIKVLESDGATLSITLPYVQNIDLPHDPKKNTVIEGIRGDGCIVIDGSRSSWDLSIQGLIYESDYEKITEAIEELEEKVAFATPYVLEVDKVEGGAEVFTYRVKRLTPITYAPSFRNGRGVQRYTITFKVNSW